MTADAPPPLRIAILVSGEGTTMDAVARAVSKGDLRATIVLAASDRSKAPAVERARRLGIPCETFLPREGPEGAWERRLVARLEELRTDLVVLAGFLRVLGPPFFERFPGRIINLHPSLLPRHSGPGMYGTRVHAAVLASGDPRTGATVHVVTEEVDRGPVLAKAEIEVRPGETASELADRQRPLEHALLIEVLGRFCRRELPLPYPVPARAAPTAGGLRG